MRLSQWISVVLLVAPCAAFAQTVAPGYWVESGGIVVIEAESIGTFPDNWRNASSTTAPDLNLSGGPASGGNFLTWEGNQFLGQTEVSTLVYPIQINNPGTYRFRWRSQTGKGTNTTEHNDTWVKIESDAFYGERSVGDIVCPKGYSAAENDCSGGVPEGGGEKGWFKVYVSGANTWRWATRTSDNEGYNIFVRFDSPGIYELMLSARSSFHIIDRIVMSSDAFGGDPESLSVPESQFVRTGGPPVQEPPVANDDSYGTATGVPLNVPAGSGVLANDSDPNGDALSAILLDDVSSGTLSLNANGGFSYTPANNFEGVATFRYRASDGGRLSAPAVVSITVNDASIRLSLINADTNNIVQPLQNGNQLSIAALGFNNWSVAASDFPAGTNSVTFALSGSLTNNQTENNAPYALFGDSSGNYAGVPLQPGNYSLQVRAHSAAGGGGTVIASVQVNFSIVTAFGPPVFSNGFEAPGP